MSGLGIITARASLVVPSDLADAMSLVQRAAARAMPRGPCHGCSVGAVGRKPVWVCYFSAPQWPGPFSDRHSLRQLGDHCLCEGPYVHFSIFPTGTDPRTAAFDTGVGRVGNRRDRQALFRASGDDASQVRQLNHQPSACCRPDPESG
jgi:hypothetical protein